MGIIHTCIFAFLLIFIFLSSSVSIANEKTLLATDKRPLVLQIEIPHPRNKDQISLVFKKNIVELVTNTSSYQKSKTVRLGRFQSSLDPRLKFWKKQVKYHYSRLNRTVPLLSFFKNLNLKPPTDIHAPVLRINKKKIHHEQPAFKPLMDIIGKAWGKKWDCVECATYENKGNSILRTVQKPLGSGTKWIRWIMEKIKNKKHQNKWKTEKQNLSKKSLKCLPKGKKKVECTDPQWGIFII
ncbi:MAG: hypothetical protein OXB84_07075 [Halobacteriovoraceae bacterium]|nr:hypothetical protein [Halobacteriovoraceae bacterium]